MPNRAQTTTQRQAYWIPAVFVGAMLLVIAVNIVMVFFATSTFPGLDTDKAYVQGLAYNETLKEAAASEALGWQAKAEIAEGGDLILSLQNAEGQPVTGMDLRGQMVRTATTSMDRVITFTPAMGQPGRYLAALDLPANGLWELRVAGTVTATGVVWQWNDRIMVP